MKIENIENVKWDTPYRIHMQSPFSLRPETSPCDLTIISGTARTKLTVGWEHVSAKAWEEGVGWGEVRGSRDGAIGDADAGVGF